MIPYFGYARQDRRAHGREAVGARLVADLIAAAGLDRVVTVDPHGATLEGCFGIPLEHLSAVPLLADALRPRVPADGVVVAPDGGAVPLAERYARRLGLPLAIVHKTRLSGERVRAEGLTGDVRGRTPVLVDDLISTGGTVAAAAEALLAAGARPALIVAVSHALLVGGAAGRLRALPLARLVITDSVVPPADPPGPLEVVTLGPLLVEAIARLHGERSVRDLVGRS